MTKLRRMPRLRLFVELQRLAFRSLFGMRLESKTHPYPDTVISSHIKGGSLSASIRLLPVEELMDRRFRLARHWSNRELRRICAPLDGAVVNVSAGDDLDKEGSRYADYFPKATSYTITNYGEVGDFRGFTGREGEIRLDLTEDLPADLRQAYDVVLNHTTLEHVFDVRMAVRNLCAMSRDLLIIVVPFAQVEHESAGYNDYWRFTPRCIRELLGENGFTAVFETANNEFNVSVYLIVVAARDPGKWADQFRLNDARAPLADWIGFP